MAQIPEYLTQDTVTKENGIPTCSAIALKKKKLLLVPMDLQELTLEALIDSGAIVNFISKTEYNKRYHP